MDQLNSQQVIEDFETYVNPALSQVLKFIGFEGVESHAEGCLVWDTSGRKYLDCLGGYGTMSVGHSHPKVIAAVKAQLDKMSQSSRVLFNAPLAALAKKLAEITPGDLQYSFICNSGTEAAEAAIKFARITTGRTKLVSTEGAYHGKTLGALSVSGRDKYKKPFAPLINDCALVPFNDIEALESAIDETVAAFLVEPVQGEGGIHVASDEYLRRARELCDTHGALLVLDEVQCGLGRTGKMWACEYAGVVPDMLLLAKALSGACVPIGAVVARPKVWGILERKPADSLDDLWRQSAGLRGGIGGAASTCRGKFGREFARAGRKIDGALESDAKQISAVRERCARARPDDRRRIWTRRYYRFGFVRHGAARCSGRAVYV